MTQIGTKFRYVSKLHRPDLHTKISHRIQHIFFIGHFKKLYLESSRCFSMFLKYTDYIPKSAPLPKKKNILMHFKHKVVII